jgi:predicted transposase YbfD/YdcC
MPEQATADTLRPKPNGFLHYFKDLPDPRANNTVHKLIDILATAFCAILCGADDWVAVQTWCQSKQAWLKTFLQLPAGIPSHDTFGRVFAALDPDAFEACFGAWTQSLGKTGRLLAFDGKSIRRSFEHAWDKSGMTHLLSAFAADQGRVLAQVSVDSKENEITAMPQLLKMLDLQGAVVSADALHCQRETAADIHQAGGDYVLAVKENQPTLYSKTKRLLDEVALEQKPHDVQTNGGHGRIETRRAWLWQATDLGGELMDQWAGLASVAMVECVREVIGGKSSVERRYFISSLKNTTARELAGYVRGHWRVENQLHWQLDVSFREDERRVRKDHGPENFSRLCRMALSRLKADKTLKVGVKNKRLAAGWDPVYLLRLLTT